MQRHFFPAAVALAVAGILSISSATRGSLIISDDFNAVTGGTSGFGLNSGVNTGIDPANNVTRLTGTAAAGLRWINRANKPDPNYGLDSNVRLKINSGAQSGRISLSPDGTAAADFGPALGTDLASPITKLEYDIRITMKNTTTGTQRMSFGWGTVETSATGWDFGVQIYKAATSDTAYTVQKRIDSLSTGLAADIDAPIGTAGTWSGFLPVLIRVDDAGAESGTDYNSRVRVSVDNGSTWIYDTSSDPDLPNGFRFDGAGRFLSLDIAGGTAATYYDNLSIDLTTPAPEPTTLGLAAAAGTMLLARRRRA